MNDKFGGILEGTGRVLNIVLSQHLPEGTEDTKNLSEDSHWPIQYSNIAPSGYEPKR
jgi:hypothetical protein